MSEFTLGIDLGATNVKGLAITPAGTVLGHDSVPTQDDGSTSWQNSVRELFDRLVRTCGGTPKFIGLAAPGLPARDQRSIVSLPVRLPGIEGLIWQDFFQVNELVTVANDAHAALLGECWKGAAQGARNAVLVTLGTGVGGAVMCDGRLLRGHLGRAGHLGHVSLDPDGSLDITHLPGSLEDAIGECTLLARTAGRFASTKELVLAAQQGDATAATVWQRSLKALAASLASFINVFDPEIIVIGGGIAQAGPPLFQPLEKLVRQFEWQIGGFTVPLAPAKLGEWAGAYGAAWQALNLEKQQ